MDGNLYGGMAMAPQMGGYSGMGMGGMGGMGMNQGMGGMGGYGGRGGGMGRGGGGARPAFQGGQGGGGVRRMDDQVVEGKLFLGGLDTNTTKQALLEYVTQWCAARSYRLSKGSETIPVH